ncbi:Gfo/Idh/MocA family protein [Paenibacillus hexagrammi]|uniref:Gfo/Idh/MocA family oxidoreductase n=1 Tax=Paenibacillus hexagrammi TaxID=2908839 RepID=A0ABY3SCU3_9BACL|nr:Gfo/Idh/MocA family oxidoreductase [Paenibacillus sp. YPD9-1]UJF31819.1 Gfo/Idh/MocA family oxidoreductase [Paenibacillus sp. YPD9-1]
MEKLKIGIIGMGGIANYHIARTMASEDAKVWAICDSNEQLLAIKGEEFNIPEERRFLNYEDMLKDADIDAVTIGTPNFNHFAVTYAAIRHRKPFALEKPIALNVREAAILRDALEEEYVPHMVCFTYRYKAAVRYAKWLIEQGKLGKIHHIYSQYFQGWAIHEEIPLTWRFQKELSGSGALGDLGSHILDLHRFLVGETIKVAAHAGTIMNERNLMNEEGKGTVDVDDYCHVLAALEDGISSTIAITRFAHGRGNYQRIEIYGTHGALVYDLEEEDELQVHFLEEDDKCFREVDIPSQFKVDQMQAFFHILNGKADGLDATIKDGYENQKTIDCIIEAFTDEKWVHIPKGHSQ